MEIAVYPGTFDPPTNGHLDVIKRASKIFTKVIVAVTDNPNKKSTFEMKERVEMLRSITNGLENVEIEEFSGLLIDYLKKRNAKIVIRGLRAVSDFEYEFQMALMNRRLLGDIETVFLIPHESYTYLSSSLVKEIAKYGGDISTLVPEKIKEVIIKRLKK